MKKFTKAVCLTLALLMITGCLSACKNNTAEEDVFELTKDQLSAYTIIVPSENSDSMMAVASFLQSMLEQALGIKLEAKTDETEQTEYEILIGLTNRAETTEFYSDLKDLEYGYALVGKKVLIVGNSANTAKNGLLLFKNDILDKADELSVLMTEDSKNIEEMPEETEESKEQNEYYADVLEGLTINALGDSYFDGEGLNRSKVWLGLLADKYDVKMYNYGKGGSTVSNKVNKNPMCERYSSMANNNADIVLLEGGRNDFNQSVPIGNKDSYDTKTFSGALNTIIKGLKEKYPNAMIVCISNWNFPGTKNGLDYADYANAMEAVANQQGVYFIKACDPDISGIDMSDEAFRAKYCLKQSDISHLNAKGMKIAMAHFEKILAEYYQDFLKKNN